MGEVDLSNFGNETTIQDQVKEESFVDNEYIEHDTSVKKKKKKKRDSLNDLGNEYIEDDTTVKKKKKKKKDSCVAESPIKIELAEIEEYIEPNEIKTEIDASLNCSSQNSILGSSDPSSPHKKKKKKKSSKDN